jgi:hypothetical protein
MHPISQNLLLSVAAASALVMLTAAALPARADDLAQNLGPVGPHDPILTTFGNKRIIAFYEPDQGRCAVQAVVWEKSDAETGLTTAARVRVSLSPRQIVHVDSTDNKSISLQCGDRARSLALVGTREVVAADVSQ